MMSAILTLQTMVPLRSHADVMVFEAQSSSCLNAALVKVALTGEGANPDKAPFL